MDALWHKVSEKEREEILDNAKSIMRKFHQALSKVDEGKEARVERDSCEREERGGEECDNDFRKIMLKNAPETKDDCIQAEKGKWTV